MRKPKPPSVGLTELMFVLGAGMLVAGITLMVLVLTGVIEGPRGPPGVNGTQGVPGVNGTQGAPGVNGTQGAPGVNGTNGGSASPEAFAIAMNANHTIDSDTTYKRISGWTDTVDTLAVPDVSPRALFRNLTTGTLNLTAGTFTVGTAGLYLTMFPQYVTSEIDSGYTCVVVNGVGTACTYLLDAAMHTQLLYLAAGDIVELQMGWGSFPGVVSPFVVKIATLAPQLAYSTVWSMTKI